MFSVTYERHLINGLQGFYVGRGVMKQRASKLRQTYAKMA